MSQIDTGVETGARAAAPIVLIIGMEGCQAYLDNNEVLEACYGLQVPQRISIPGQGLRHDSWEWEFFFPDLDNGSVKLMLLEEFPDVSVNGLVEFLRSDTYYEFVYTYLKRLSGLPDAVAKDVRAVIFPKYWAYEISPIFEVTKRYFPNATLLIAESEHSRPQRYHPEAQSQDEDVAD